MKSIQSQTVLTARGRGAWAILFLVLFAVVAGVVFHTLWSPGAVLMSSDDNVGLLRMYQRMLEASTVQTWNGEALWGLPAMSMVRPASFLLKMLPATVFINLFHGLTLTLSAWLLALYLRDKGLRPAACVFGGLVAFWVGTNLTLTYAGHAGKYGLMPFLALSLFALGRWGSTGRMAWSLVVGAAVGAMFLEQSDVALFCALLLLPIGLFEASKAAGSWKVLPLIKKSWGAAVVAALLAGGVTLAALGSGVTEVPGGESPEAQWGYLTQWSQPPGESLDFIAPGWTGWRSGDPKGPYWGKMGRSDGWEQTRQGFMNFKLENVYVGAIPLLFAAMALGSAFRRRRDKDVGIIWLWAGLCVVSLLLAFGKFFPLYRPLSMLPGFGSIRNPNKFIHFFQLSWGVLAAFGLDAAIRMERASVKRWLWAAGIVSGLLLLSGLALWSDLTAGAARLSAMGWGAMGQPIQWNKAFSVTYAAGAFALGGGILWLLQRPAGRKRVWLAWLPALVVLFDAAVILAPHYIQTMPSGFVAENELVRYLKHEIGHHRTAMATQDGFYNQWLTYLFPYQGIPSVNVTQLPRPPADYTAFWGSVKDPVRMWQLTGVSHVLAHGPVASQLLANPAWAAQLEPVWAYQPVDDGQGGVGTRSVPWGPNAPEVVLKMKNPPPRVAAVSSWREVTDDEALNLLASPSFVPYESVLLPPGSQVEAPPLLAGEVEPPQVKIARIIPGRYEFTVKNQGPVVVRVSEKYDAGWEATVDGQPVPVIRCDYMFQGIPLEKAGTHEIILRYAPSSGPIYLQWAGILVGFGAAFSLLWAHRRRSAE